MNLSALEMAADSLELKIQTSVLVFGLCKIQISVIDPSSTLMVLESDFPLLIKKLAPWESSP